jgi:pteridine reductase
MTERVALITGGARRIGAAIVAALHAEGLNVVIHYRRSQAEAEALADRLNALRPASAASLAADLLDTTAIAGLAERAVRCFGRLDALVNNASSFFPTPLGTLDAAAWDDLVGTNARAPVFLTQALAAELRRNAGAVVNIADIHAEFPLRAHLAYNVGKAGLLAATRSLARELGPEARVNAVAPGANLWPEGSGSVDAAARRRILDQCILKRAGTPEDIAAAVRFLILDALYVTGQVLVVDGGRSIVLAD